MKIVCEKCGTGFKADDSLIKDAGTKVRCSVCKHVFTVYPPQKEPVEGRENAQEESEAADEDIRKAEKTSDDIKHMEEKQGTDKDNEEPVSTSVPDQSEFPEEEDAGSEDSLDDFDHDFSTEEQDSFDALNHEDLDDGNEEEGGLQPSLAEDGQELSENNDEREEQENRSDDNEKNDAKQKTSFFSHGIMIFTVIVCILLVVTVSVYFFAPSNTLSLLSRVPKHEQQKPPLPEQQKPDPGIEHLAFESVSGFFVTSDRAGRLFVIKGLVKNNYSSRRSFIRVRGKILDEKHQPIKIKEVFAGAALGKNEISTLSQAEIDNIGRNRSGEDNQNVNVPASGAVPFVIIFSNLPDNMSEFTVEAVSSSPGTS